MKKPTKKEVLPTCLKKGERLLITKLRELKQSDYL